MDESQKKLLFATPNLIVYPRKFDTALRRSTVQRFLHRWETNTLTDDDNLISSHLTQDDLQHIITESTYYPALFSDLYNRSEHEGVIFPNYTHKQYASIFEALELTVMTQVKYMNHSSLIGFEQQVESDLRRRMRSLEFPSLVLNMLELYRCMDMLVTKSNVMYDPEYKKLPAAERIRQLKRVTSFAIPEIDSMFIWSHKLVLIRMGERIWLLPKSYILLIHNKFCDFLSVAFLALFTSGAQYPRNMYQITVRFLVALAELFVNYGKDAYGILKMLESYCVAECILELDAWVNDEFLRALQREGVRSYGFDYKTSALRQLIRQANIPVRHELSCLSKMMGHPLVDMEEGAKSLHEKATEIYDISLARISECTNYIKENYIRNYISRHKKWPPCAITSPNCHAGLREAWARGIDPNSAKITMNHGPTPVDSYNFVELLPNMKFEKLEYYVPYLKDKTISCLRQEVMQMYLEHRSDVRSSWKDTRLLLYYLMNDKSMTNHVEALNMYLMSDDMEGFLDYLVIRVVPKEKELKEVFRGFGCQTYMDRARRLAQEKNAMHYLDLYSDEQAMTLSDLALLKKLYSFRVLSKAYANHTVLYINLDASSWNNHFRKETVDRVMSHTLDRIFDVKCYGKTHQAFENTLVVVPDEGVTYAWEGQAGGIEGLNQDTWVIVYIGQIKTALARFGLKYHVLCKGDDFRIALLIPPTSSNPEDISRTKNEVVEHISKIAKELGHKIKIEESYGSEVYFTFSKSASVKTIEMPQMYRKIQKTHGANNAFLMTLDDYIASTFSNAHSACKVGPVCIAPYMVACMWSLLYLSKSEYYQDCSPDELAACLMVPSLLGGFPIIYLHNMAVRAESDLLSPFLGLLGYTKTHCGRIYNVLKRFVKVPSRFKGNIKLLASDPYAIPNDRPILPSSLLKQLLSPLVKAVTKNEDVIKLYQAAEDTDMKRIIRCLESSNVFNPKVIANIYAATPAGLWQKLLTQFESSRSVYELLILRKGVVRANRILRRILRAEDKLQRWRKNRLRGNTTSTSKCALNMLTACPAESAQKLREYCFRKPIEGVTMPPLQHQLSFVTPAIGSEDEWSRRNHFNYYPAVPTEILPRCTQLHWASSGCTPFLGFTTRKSTTEPQLHMVEKDVILTQMKTLLDLSSWVAVEGPDPSGEIITSNYPDLINLLLKYYTRVDATVLDPFIAVRKSGTRQHHMRSPSFRESIMPNVLSNVYQQISGESNSHITYRNSRANFAVNFLHIYCYSVDHIFQELYVKPTWSSPSIVWAVTTRCHFCTAPIEDSPLRCDINIVKNVKPIILMSTDMGTISKRILKESLEEFTKRETTANAPPTVITLEEASIGVLQELIDQCYTSRSTLQDRYTQHPVSAEGHQVLVNLLPHTAGRLIGLTEIKLIPIRLLCQSIQHLLFFELPKILTDLSVDTIWVKLSQLPGTELPWYGLMLAIYRAGRLAEVVGWFYRKTSVVPGPIYYAPAQAAYYVGGAAFISSLMTPVEPTLVLLSYYNSGQFNIHLGRILYCLQWHYIFKEYCSYMRNVPLHLEDQDARDVYIMLAAQALMISNIKVDDPDYLQPIQDHMRDQGRGQTTLLEILEEDWSHYESYGDFLDQAPNLVHLLIHVNRHCPWEEVFNYIQEEFDIVKTACDDQLMHLTVNTVVTDLSACILAVRATAVNDDDDQELELNGDVPHGDPRNIVYGLPRLQNPRWCVPYENVSTRVAELIPVREFPTFQDIPANKTYMGTNDAYRLYGSTNSSINHLLFIFASLGIHPSANHRVNALCLADGMGGLTTGVLATWPESYVVFNTKKEHVDTECEPHEALTSLPAVVRRNLQYNHLDEGYDDLSQPWVSNYYATLDMRFNVITCDVEVQSSDTAEYAAILSNLVHIITSVAMPKALCIIKMSYHHVVTNCQIIQWFSRNFHRVSLCRPPSMGVEPRFYLVAWAPHRTWTSLSDIPNNMASLECQTSINRFYRRSQDSLELMVGSNSHGLAVDVGLIRTLSPWKERLPPRVCAYGPMRLNTLICTPSTLEHVIEYRSLSEAIVSTLNDLERPMDELMRVLTNAPTSSDRRHHWDQTTRAHQIAIAERWLKLRGLQDGIHVYSRQLQLTLDINTLRRRFIIALEMLPARLRWNPDSREIYKRTYRDDNGVTSKPYVSYLMGWKGAVLFAATVTAYRG